MTSKRPEGMSPLIGPHEGREFELMRAGGKHVALFCEIKPEGYEEMITNDEFASFEFEINNPDLKIPYWIVYRKTHVSAAEELLGYYPIEKPCWNEARERRTGQILSYPPEAIDYFITSLKAKGLLNS